MSTCPISNKSIDVRVCRLNNLVMAVGCAAFIITLNEWVLFAVSSDYFIRSFLSPKLSPVATINSALLKLLKVKPARVDAAPKIFAARMGFFCSLFAGVLYLGFSVQWAVIFVAMLLTFTTLDALFGLCMGCKIYSFLRYIKVIPNHDHQVPTHSQFTPN